MPPDTGRASTGKRAPARGAPASTRSPPRRTLTGEHQHNDPLNYTDPTGLISWGDVAGTVVIAGHVAGAALAAYGFVGAAGNVAAAGAKVTQVGLAGVNATKSIQRTGTLQRTALNG